MSEEEMGNRLQSGDKKMKTKENKKKKYSKEELLECFDGICLFLANHNFTEIDERAVAIRKLIHNQPKLNHPWSTYLIAGVIKKLKNDEKELANWILGALQGAEIDAEDLADSIQWHLMDEEVEIDIKPLTRATIKALEKEND